MAEANRRSSDPTKSFEWLALAASLPADPIPVPAGGGSGLVISGRVIITGLSITSSAGVAGTVNVLDGADAKGSLIDPIQIAANGAVARAYSGRGVLCEQGVYLVVAGAVLAGSVYVIHLWRYPRTPPGE